MLQQAPYQLRKMWNTIKKIIDNGMLRGWAGCNRVAAGWFAVAEMQKKREWRRFQRAAVAEVSGLCGEIIVISIC